MYKKAVVFLNGTINSNFCTLNVLSNYKDLPIYCADGAYDKVVSSRQLRKNVVQIIGDGDSIRNSKTVKYTMINDQNYTDFEKIMLYLIKCSFEEVIIYGGGGKEMDHYLGNISVLIKYNNHIKCKLIDEYGYSILLGNEIVERNVKGRMISIIPMFRLKRVRSEGLKFKLDNRTLEFGSQIGIRNCATEKNVKISSEKGEGIVFISHKKYNY